MVRYYLKCTRFPTLAYWFTDSPAFSHSHRAVALPAVAPVYRLYPNASWVQRREACFGGVFWLIVVVYDKLTEHETDKNRRVVAVRPF
jgi:hypothetical protein